MVKYVDLTPSLGKIIGDLASRAEQVRTRPSGTIVTQNADGTKTILGEGAGAAGVAQWVGDTTPPGKPTGLSVSSTAGVVTVTWDGSLVGGVPADFSHVRVTATDGTATAVQELSQAGSLVFDAFSPGVSVSVTAVALDAARLEDGSLSPNVSEVSDAVSVIVVSSVSQAEVDQIAADLSENSTKITDLNTGLSQAQADLAEAQSDVQQALSDAAAAQAAAGAAGVSAADAQSAAQSAASAAATAQARADSAYTGATTARQTASAAQSAADALVRQSLNVCANPSFEQGRTGWVMGKSNVVDASDAHHGSKVMQMVGAGAWLDALGTYTPSQAGRTWQATAWVRVTTTGATGMVALSLRTATLNDLNPVLLDLSTLSVGTWVQLKMQWTATTDESVAVKCQGQNTTPAGVTVQWDDVTLRDITDAKAALDAATAAQQTADTATAAAAAAQQAADTAQAAALLAQSKADTASDKASTADGRVTVATANPTTADAAGKPVGAIWEVRSGGTVLRRFVLTAATTWTQVKAGQDWIGDKAIGQAQIGDLAVGTAQVADAAITDAKIGSLNAGKITAGTLDAARIASGAISTDKLAANSVTAGKILAGAVGADQLAANSVNASKIVSGSITANELASNSVTAVKIASQAVTADKIKAGAITAEKLSATAIDGMTITGATIIAEDADGEETVRIDGATGKLTAVEAELVDANVSGTFQNLTSTTSTTIDTDGIEIKGTGWKLQNSEPVPEFIAGKCFASESSSIAGGVWPRTIYTWKSDGSSLYNMTKITLSGINIDGLTWLGASKLAVLGHDEASGIYTWKVGVVNLSGVTQATYTVPDTTPSSGSAVIAQIPGGSGFYVAVGRYGATGNIYRYDSSGVVQSSWSLPVSSPGSSSTVRAIAVDPAGNLYLAQDWTISSYTPTGTLRWSFAGSAWTMTYDNWHGYLVIGQNYGITWYVGATGVEVDRIISPDMVQGLVYSSGDLFVSSNVGPKIIRAMWGTPSNGIGDSVVIDASSGNAAFRNIVAAMSVQSNFPMLQADGERVTGAYVVTQRSDLDSIPTSHLVPGLSRGYVQHVASNQTDYGDYVWSGSGWVPCATLLDVSDLLTARPDGAYPIEFVTATLNTRTRVITMSARVRREISKSTSSPESMMMVGPSIRPAAGQGASGWGGRDSAGWTVFVATSSDNTSIQGTPFGSVVNVGEHVTWSLSWLTA